MRERERIWPSIACRDFTNCATACGTIGLRIYFEKRYRGYLAEHLQVFERATNGGIPSHSPAGSNTAGIVSAFISDIRIDARNSMHNALMSVACAISTIHMVGKATNSNP
jgi:hypothetical protein